MVVLIQLQFNFDPLANTDNNTCQGIVLGCTDSTALNYNPLANTDDGTCLVAAMVDLFFSEYAEGSSNNKYLEIYNPTADTVYLSDYAYPSVSNAPSTAGVYEFWNSFDAGAVILPNDVYIVAHGSSDPLILAESDETHPYLSNGDDGYALVYGANPGSPVDALTGGYVILDFIGDWNGDPGSGWSVAGVSNATKDHTLVRKCDVTQGNSDWTLSAGNDSLSSEWIVLNQDDWSHLGMHSSSCSILGCIDTSACNYDSGANTDDGSCTYAAAGFDCAGNCLTTPLTITTEVCASATEVRMTGPWWGWDPTQGPIAADNGDGTWTFTFCPAPTADMEYLLVVDGVQENLINAPHPDIDGDGNSDLWECAPITDYWSYANRLWVVGSGDVTNTYATCGTCTDVLGCTDNAALNYDPLATLDDASCILPGCTGTPLNWTYCYDSNESGGPVFVGNNATDVVSIMFNTGTFESCCDDITIYDGMDNTAAILAGPLTDVAGLTVQSTGQYLYVEINSDASWSCQSGQNGGPQIDADYYCSSIGVEGCTDNTASNYDPSANLDDGSCLYCTDNTLNANTYTDYSGSEISWNITDDAGSVVVTSAGNYGSYLSYDQAACLPDGCYTLNMFDSWGDGWCSAQGCVGVFTLTDASGDTIVTGGLVTGESSGSIDFSLNTNCDVLGCTDNAALNYDPLATLDDASCILPGCTGTALNWTYCYDSNESGGPVFVGNNATDVVSIMFNTGTFESCCDDITIYDGMDNTAAILAGPLTDVAGLTVQSTGQYLYVEINSDASWSCQSGQNGGPQIDADYYCSYIEVEGCIDTSACNYDSGANTDDGSCTYAAAGFDCAGNCLTTPLTITTEVCASATEVRMTGPWWGWDPTQGPIAADNGDGTWTFTFCPAPTADMEYLLVVDGVQENLINAPHPDIDGDGYGDLWGCAPITDYWSYANRLWVVGSGDVTNTYATCGTCTDVYGCMDASANNYDATATVNDQSVCTYDVLGCTDAAAFNYNVFSKC